MNNRSSSCSKAKRDAEYDNTDSEPTPLPAGKLLALWQPLRSGSVSLLTGSRNVRPGLTRSNRNPGIPGHRDQPQPPQVRSESEPGPGPGPEIPQSRPAPRRPDVTVTGK
jgi:hypothetical protein